MTEIFETLMIICFGISWPLSIIKSVKSKTARGKSIFFSFFVLTGYGFGIFSKIVGGNITYVFFFYILNFFMVFTDICLYFRNTKYDRQISADDLCRRENN